MFCVDQKLITLDQIGNVKTQIYDSLLKWEVVTLDCMIDMQQGRHSITLYGGGGRFDHFCPQFSISFPDYKAAESVQLFYYQTSLKHFVAILEGAWDSSLPKVL